MQMTDIEIITSYQRTRCPQPQITIQTQLNGCGINHILCKKNSLLCANTAENANSKKSN